MARVGRLGLGLLVLGLAGLAPAEGAARLGPPEGSPAWIRGQALLQRPASALREAQDARTRGDRLRAEWLLAETARRHAVIADYADSMRAELLLEAGRAAEAADVADRALEEHPATPLRSELLAVKGHALAERHDEAGAREAWRVALYSTRDADLRASLLLAVAASQERSGDVEAAIETLRLLWHLYPVSDEAARAAERLAAFEAERGKPLRSALDWRRRGDKLYEARRNPEALEAYETALRLGLSKQQEARTRRSRAQTLFRMRDYARAVEAYAELPQTGDVPIWYARSLARADRVPEAIAAFEVLASRGSAENARRARFLVALLLEGRGKSERARAHLERLVRGRSGRATRQASLWRLGWAAYREGRYAEAIERLDRMLANEDDPIGGLRARYWRARALESLAREGPVQAQAATDARLEFEQLALDFPLSYYGWRARQRLPEDSRKRIRSPHPSTRLVSGSRKLTSNELERARILVEAGFDERAVQELAGFARRAGGVEDRLELAQLYRSSGHFRGAQQMVVDAYKVALAGAPTPTREELWWHAWPAAYLQQVEEETSRPGSVDAALVYSIMREESGFRPEVVSPVGARGLLQIMEPTGERLARAVGHPDFEADDLFDPDLNIRLGAHYLAELSRRFDGRLSAVIASYNAGPEAVAGWLEARPELEDDEWVEAIPYDQTRSYVRRVLRSLEAYRLLY